MKTLFLLSKEDLKIAEAEFRAVMKKRFKIDRKLIVCSCDEKEIKKAEKRLACCNSVFELLFSCSAMELEEKIREYDWETACRESYVVRKINCPELKDEKYYGSIIWGKLKNPKVDLKNARTKIFLICAGKAYAVLFLSNADKSYLRRAAAIKAARQPVAIGPKLAKVMVNLTGAEKNEVIADPFCGTGGILIEAGIMGMETCGWDVSGKMLKLARHNLERNMVKRWKLMNGDATKVNINADYVVSDLPYGRNSRVTQKPEQLYASFLLNIKKSRIKKAVLGTPSFIDFKKVIKKSGFSLENEFEHYIHKSLTKKVFVLKND